MWTGPDSNGRLGGGKVSQPIFKTVVFAPPDLFQDFAFQNMNKVVGRLRFSSNLLTERNELSVDDFSCVRRNKFIKSLLDG